MGSLYRPKYKDTQDQKHEIVIWWMQYYTQGKCIRESAQTSEADFSDAAQRLEQFWT